MDETNKNLIEQKINSLPSEFREAIRSVNPFEKSLVIARENGLHLDQTDVLATAVMLCMLGILEPTRFVPSLIEHLEISRVIAEKISEQVKEKILLPIRQKLIENSAVVQKVNSTPETTRDSILAEIENPTPTNHPISIAKESSVGPATVREVTSDINQTVARNFISGKLTETVHMPSERTTITPPVSEKPKSYPSDPYREPVA